MKYNSPRSKWTFSGLVLIAVFIFVFILFRAGALSRIPLPGSQGAAGPDGHDIADAAVPQVQEAVFLKDLRHFASSFQKGGFRRITSSAIRPL